MNEKVKQLLRDLGAAMAECVGRDEKINWHIQKIRDEGYNFALHLDGKIILLERGESEEAPEAVVPEDLPRGVQFRINRNDLSILQGCGIDPTRKVKSEKKSP